MRPRYMNVPSPAPCHANVAGVGQQSVWGLRIITRSQLSLWHYSLNSSIPPSVGTHMVCNVVQLVRISKLIVAQRSHRIDSRRTQRGNPTSERSRH